MHATCAVRSAEGERSKPEEVVRPASLPGAIGVDGVSEERWRAGDTLEQGISPTISAVELDETIS